MAVRIQMRRGTSSEWNDADPILNEGELGYNSTLAQLKIGDGSTIWSELTYLATDEELVTSLEGYIEISEKGAVDGVAELNEKVRSGTKWTKVIDFLSWVQENKFDFEFNTVLHKNNFHGIFDLHEFIKKYNKKWYVNILTYPDNLDITNLSKQKLQEFLLKLKKYDIPNKQFIINHITKEHQ